MTAPSATLAPRDYLDPDRYRAEREAVFRSGWLPACRADEVPTPGDQLAVTLLGVPLLVVRTADGIAVHGNVCPHRGSRLIDDGPCSSSTLVCPYHRWAFRLDGTLIGAPLAETGVLDDVRLPAVRHTEWEGFVFVNLSGDADDLRTQLAGLSAHLEPWRWSELVTVARQPFESTWNWKVMVENWIECYHHIGTHRDSLEPFQPARTTTLVDSHGAPWVATTVEGIDGMEGAPEERIPGLSPEQARLLDVWAAFPLLLGGSVGAYAFWLRVEPIDERRHRVVWHLLAHPAQRHLFDAAAIEHHMAVISTVHAEDMATCAAVQAGLDSGMLQQLRLVQLEAPIAHFQRWVNGRLDVTH